MLLLDCLKFDNLFPLFVKKYEVRTSNYIVFSISWEYVFSITKKYQIFICISLNTF